MRRMPMADVYANGGPLLLGKLAVPTDLNYV